MDNEFARHPNFEPLIEAIKAGTTNLCFEMLAPIEELEAELDPGCRGVLVDWDYQGRPGEEGYCIMLTFDCSAFMGVNDMYLKRNYYDTNGEPTLKATETNYWPKNNRVVLYLNGWEDPMQYMMGVLCTSSQALAAWRKDRDDGETYIAFLEREYMRQRYEIGQYKQETQRLTAAVRNGKFIAAKG